MTTFNLFSPGLKVDYHEPTDIQMGLDVPGLMMEVVDLNGLRFADYMWYGADGTCHHWERKTWSDLAKSWDDVEYQLREQQQAHPDARLGLIIEGVAEPAPKGIIIYSRKKGQNVMVGYQEGNQPGLYKKIVNGLHGMRPFLEVQPTVSYAGTIVTIAGLYAADQEDEHSIFHRNLKRIDFNPNRHVAALMGLAQNDSNMGVSRCEDVIAEYGTLWNAIHEDPKMVGAMVKGVSEVSYRSMLRRIGRPDV